MRKRVAAAMLWLFAGWTFGSFAAFMTGAPDVLGPILGTAAAAIFAGDPRRLIWASATRNDRTAPATTRQVGNPA